MKDTSSNTGVPYAYRLFRDSLKQKPNGQKLKQASKKIIKDPVHEKPTRRDKIVCWHFVGPIPAYLWRY